MRLRCLGDSHINVMSYLAEKGLLCGIGIEVLMVPGATNMGLANPNSKTNALNLFNDFIDQAKPEDILVFCLGEVDCGFVIWWRAEKLGTPVSEQFELSLGNYKKLLKRASQKVRGVIVLSAPLPTIMDGQDWGEIANLRREVQTPKIERTQLTITYNKKLKAFCKRNGFSFVDMVPRTLDASTGLVDERFLNPDPCDHHLNNDVQCPIMARLIKRCIARITARSGCPAQPRDQAGC